MAVLGIEGASTRESAGESAALEAAAATGKDRVVVMSPSSGAGRPEPAVQRGLSTGGRSCGQLRAGRRLPAGAGLVAGGRINSAVHSLG